MRMHHTIPILFGFMAVACFLAAAFFIYDPFWPAVVIFGGCGAWFTRELILYRKIYNCE